MLSRLVTACVLLCTASGAAVAQPILLGQTDTFQNGSTHNWTNGIGFPDPVNIANGGPNGTGDRYLQVTSGALGQPPRITTFNISQWTGNYVSAGVTRIEMDLLNLTGSAMSMRWAMRTSSGPQFTAGYVSTNAFNLPADGLWHHAVFLLDAASLSGQNGPPPLNSFLTAVGEARILHSAAPSLIGDPGSFQFGVDNIFAGGAAVPELTTWALVGLTACCFGALWRKRTAPHSTEAKDQGTIAATS